MGKAAHCRQVVQQVSQVHTRLLYEGKIHLSVKQVFEREAVFLHRMIGVGHAQITALRCRLASALTGAASRTSTQGKCIIFVMAATPSVNEHLARKKNAAPAKNSAEGGAMRIPWHGESRPPGLNIRPIPQ